MSVYITLQYVAWELLDSGWSLIQPSEVLARSVGKWSIFTCGGCNRQDGHAGHDGTPVCTRVGQPWTTSVMISMHALMGHWRRRLGLSARQSVPRSESRSRSGSPKWIPDLLEELRGHRQNDVSLIADVSGGAISEVIHRSLFRELGRQSFGSKSNQYNDTIVEIRQGILWGPGRPLRTRLENTLKSESHAQRPLRNTGNHRSWLLDTKRRH